LPTGSPDRVVRKMAKIASQRQAVLREEIHGIEEEIVSLRNLCYELLNKQI
jgi:hypothetical protein